MDSRALYIDLLQRAVRNELYREPPKAPDEHDLARARTHLAAMRERLGPVMDKTDLTPERVHALWRNNNPPAHTVCDRAQLDNVRDCIEQVLSEGVPGDLIEAGVFRGGQPILMRGVLKAHGVTDRKVFVADSFQGLPEPDPTRDLDDAIALALLDGVGRFRVSAQAVRDAFLRYGLLDEQVVFLEGWFKDVLPSAPIERLAVIRLDGDFYESTRDALQALYPKLSSGGFAIIDDYGIPIGCRRAVDEYRAAHGIGAELVWVNRQTTYWRKP